MNKTKLICINAAIAALYFGITTFTQAISFGPIQFRPAEAFALLPTVLPYSYIGLTVGCLLANLWSPFGVWDIVIGSIVTLIAGVLTSKIKNIYIAALPPIFLNSLILPLIWLISGSDVAYFYNFLTITLGQAAVIYALGLPLSYASKKLLLR